jgi:hypothetical protein
MDTRLLNSFTEKLEKISENIDYYMKFTKDTGGKFGGPSIYFHQEAIKEGKKHFLSERHLEMIYAMLPSWGMHRMGDYKVKTINYDLFLEQIENNKKSLLKLRNINYYELNLKERNELINDLVELILNIKVNIADTQIVSSSKVVHHILPNLVCPIDKEYTIHFLIGDKIYQNKYEKMYLEIILHGMFKFIGENIIVLNNNIDEIFNTSLTKIFDNLIITYKKRLSGKIDFAINSGDNFIELLKKYPLLSADDLKKKIKKLGFEIQGAIIVKSGHIA